MDKGRGSKELDTISSTLVPGESPVIKRMRASADYILQSVKGAGGPKNPIYTRILGEMLNEVKEMPPEFLEIYLARIGQIFLWTANGEGDFPFPDMDE